MKLGLLLRLAAISRLTEEKEVKEEENGGGRGSR